MPQSRAPLGSVQGTRKPARKKTSTTNKARGQSSAPENPTGRLVIGPAVAGAASVSHWLPDAKKTGTYSWKCPECGEWFAWSVDRSVWEASTPEAAVGGLFG